MNSFYDPKWSLSFQGQPIELHASSKAALSGPSHPLLMIGGVHGDEPEGVELAKKTLKWLKSESYQKHPKAKKEWILIPCINPDGYLKDQRTNAQGIDLNRNFPTKNWSSSFEKERYFPGNFPLESPEAKSLVDLILSSKPKVIFHFHSWQPCVVIKGPENHPYAQALANSSGYDLVNDIGYPTPGSLGHYGWDELGIPVICVEEQEKIDLSKVWGHFEKGIQDIFLNLPSS